MRHKQPGVIRIGYLRCSQLPVHLVAKSRAGVPIAVTATPQSIEIIGEATYTHNKRSQNNEIYESTTLDFRTSDEIPQGHIAWVIDTAAGDRYLIGTREAPWPQVESTSNSGNTDGEPAVTSVKVTMKGPATLIPVI